MQIDTQITILKSFATEENPDILITEVRYDYTGDLEESITVEIYHYHPLDEEQVMISISNRGESEKTRLVAIKRVADILNNGNLNGAG